jgi:CRISPR system Cascade subunit CasE
MNTLHLTQITISHEDAIKSLRIRDSYSWHQLSWSVFAASRDGLARDFLFRVDRDDDSFRLLLLSQSEPVRPGWCPADRFQSKLVPEVFLGHERYRFTLRANPTKKIDKRRVPLTTDEELAAWMERKALAGGFAVDHGSLLASPVGREGFVRQGVYGHHAVVEFQGVLTVACPEAFRRTIATGIGSAKAFGFGMLVLTPISLN